MRKCGLIGILFVVLFMLPVTSPTVGQVIATESLPPIPEYDGGYAVSDIGELSSGTGLPLDVSISGVVSNEGESPMQISSGTSGTSLVTIDDGWTGSNLNAEIDTLTMVAEDTLNNGHLDDTHNEQFLVTSDTSKNDDVILIPDGWTVVKDVPNDDTHPMYGAFRLSSHSAGYGSTYGVRMVASYSGGFNHTAGEEIYLSQMVSLPWREVYSMTVSFRYFVESSSTLDDQVHLFIRTGRVTREFHIFESGDSTDTWLPASIVIQASSMSDLSSYVTQFDIGLTSNLSGFGYISGARVRIDDIEADFTVRPFPEQVDLKANGTLVWGSTSGSVYPYVPDDANRDCYDTPDNGGLDLDGYGNDGGLGTGLYSGGGVYILSSTFQSAFQFPVDIPQGAIITNAYFEVEAQTGSGSPLPGMRIHVADESNFTAFTSGGASLENRYSWLNTSIDWTVNSWVASPTVRYQSPNIGPLVQQVISNSTWSSGNFLCLRTDYMYGTTYQQWNDLKGSSNYDGTSLARLFVEYVIPEDEDTVIFFNYQKDITIDHTKVAATLTNFPVLIDITDPDLQTKVLSGGNDIAFKLDNEPLAHDIELFEQSSGHLIAWVKVPILSSTTDTVITMLYGSENAPASNSGNVWDDYATVQHLNNDPSGIIFDSTFNNHDGTPYGTMDSNDLIDGKIGDAISFDGTDDMICIGQIDTDQWTQFTMSAWVYHTFNDDNRVFSKSLSTSPTSHIITLRVAKNRVSNRINTDGVGGTGLSQDGNTTVTLGAWHYISWSWSASRESVICYMDGNPVIEVTCDGDTILDSDAVFVIGNTDLLNDRFWNGYIDEARLTTMVRSEDWVNTEYNNQNNPSGFYSVETESVIADTWTEAGDTQVVFTTSSPTPVTLQTYITMDISGEGQTLDENFDLGTSFYIESGSSIVNWTAKVMVSPPAGATSLGFTVEYPMAEWKPTAVLNPFNSPKTISQDWWYQGGTLTINASSIDFWGIWTLKFISWNFVDDLALGITGQSLSTTAIYNIGDSMKFLATTPTVNGASVGFVITDPSGTIRYTGTNSTVTSPGHKFPSFEYRKDFTIDPADVIQDVDSFPVAIDITDTDLHNPAKVRSDGSDIMFTQGDIIIPHQIEFFKQDYDIVNARLVAWVSANLSASATTTITMYYGSPVVDNLENPDGVWGSSYDAVWHLGEDVTDESSGEIHYDATTNNYDGTHNGNSRTASSRVGYAQNFDGDDYITITDTLTPPGDVTITGWFYISSTHSSSSPSTQVLMEKYIDIDHDMVIALVGQDYGHSTAPNGSLVFKVESSTDSAQYKWTTRTTWTPGWYYIGCLADEDNPDGNQIFVGTSAVAGMDTDVNDPGNPSQANISYVEDWQLGGGNYDSGIVGQGWFTGYLDEWRVSSTLRTENWLWNEWKNQYDTSGFLTKGSEQQRTSPDHTFTQTLGNFDAGVWTVSTYYNDTGTSVSTRTGLFERTFTVKRDTILTLTKPTDDISAKTAGDALIIEFELKDTAWSSGIEDATVTLNWTSPATITLDDYGGGVYGKVLDTDDLADAKRWCLEVDSSHPFYNDPSTKVFYIDLYHTTELDSSAVTTTPVGNDFTTTVTFTDTYTGLPITDAEITFDDDTPVQHTHLGSGVYSVTIDTAALALGDHIYTFKATSADTYLNVSTTSVTFNLRSHYTAMSVTGDFITPHGDTTDVSANLFDLDSGSPLTASVVTSVTYSWIGDSHTDFALINLDATIDTSTWNIGVYTINVTMIMSDGDYEAPTQISFTIEIRKRYTALTVSGMLNQPYGNMTPLSILLIDLDDGSTLGSSLVSNFNFSWPGGYYDHAGGGSFSFNLDTSIWGVGSKIVTVTTTMSSPNYEEPAQFVFTITIRSVSTVMYTGPTSFNFTLGSDFTVDLHLNITESGQFYTDPITGRLAGEFSVPGYVISIDTSQQANGLYTLTISETYFTGGNYDITVFFTSADEEYSDAFIEISFYYREIVSYLSSPNYPQVTTPYQLDVEIILEYADADFGTGIEGATITSPDHPTWIINQTDLTGGSYNVFIDVSSLAQGTHFISLTADKSGYDAKTLQFRIVIRAAFTSIIPSVGSLDIPIGSSYVFYVDYTDVDRLVPIDNATTPYTTVVSTWTNYTVVYESGNQRYKITFFTSDSDTISQNIVYGFTFSKGVNYQPASFNVSVSIRTHNTDFRIVSSIEPTSTTGIFNISVYYGDLDDNIGIKSADVVFSVQNASGLVISSYDYDTGLGDGYYIIQVSGSQFGLGLQTFTIYADWTAVLEKYQDKSFVTSANVVGRISSLTLLVAADPTPYLDSMSYTFFFSDSGIGISNLTGNVFMSVSFQGETVNPADVTITDWSATQPGNYSIDFNTDIFSRIGLIYMDISVEWAKGVAPYYSNRTDTISVRVLQRDTLLQVSPPSPTSFGETVNFTFTFDDVTGAIDIPINDDAKLTITLNGAVFSYSEIGGLFTITIDTTQFGAVGPQVLTLSVTWDGAPFYANKTGRTVNLNVINRETFVEYLAPAPTQYLDEVMFNVTWTDITNGANDPITGATLSLFSDGSPVDLGKYSYFEIASGIYQITLNTTYAIAPSTYAIRVDLSIGSTGVEDVSVSRDFRINSRITLLSAEPVTAVAYNSSIVVVLYYQDLFTSAAISNESANGYPVTLQIIGGDGSGWIYTATWRPGFGDYILTIETYNQAYMTYTPYTLDLRMSYASQSPFYATDDLTIEFELRNRQTSLGLTTEAETTPYGDDVVFTVFYGDTDASNTGIIGATIVVLNNSIPLVELTHYTLSEGSGFYTITIFSQYLGDLGSHTVEVQASWGAIPPYYDASSRNVDILVRERETNVEITVAPSQTRYLDNVTFTFVYTDLDASVGINTSLSSNIHLKFLNGTEIFGYTIDQVGASIEITVNSALLSAVPVSGLSIIVQVDWLDSDSPFYADDETIVKVTITGRTFLVETDQVARTPKDDVMVITVTITDMDNGAPVEGATILFTSQNESMIVGTHYDKFEGGGVYRFDVYTDMFVGIGILMFDIEVQWAFVEPFYSNSSTITINGLVDYVRTSLQASAPNPSTVQITGNVSFLVNYRDLDHNLPITGADGAISVVYEGGGLIGTSLLIFETVTAGIYNISFSTIILGDTGIYTIEISIQSSKYAYVSVTPQFTVTLINSALAPLENSYQVSYTETANIIVDFMDTFHGYNITGASLAWYLGETFGGYLTETGPPGQYRVDIDTGESPFGADTFVLTIRGNATTYNDAITTVTLVILSLPSDIIFVEPTTGVVEVNRGNAVPIVIQLNDTLNNLPIDGSQTTDVYIFFNGEHFPLTWNGTHYNGILPGSRTIQDPGSYDVRVTATFINYQPASEQFKILVLQTETTLKVIGDTEIDAVYSQVVNFTLKLTEDAYNTTVINATLYWYEQAFGELNLTFTYDPLYEFWILSFNTSQGFYGTWGLTFRAFPDNATLASTTATVTLTIKKITTEIITPLISPEVYWGWTGYISFLYNDTFFNEGIPGSSAEYSYGSFNGQTAMDLGNGTYLVFINTTYLTPNTQHRIRIDFLKDNYEARSGGINIFVNLRPTELTVQVDNERTYETSENPTMLEIPMGDSIDITFLFNDTSLVGGLNGGLDNAGIIGTLNAPSYFTGSSVALIGLGSGFYTFVFDTNNLTYYETNDFVKIILDGQFFLTVEFAYPNRVSQSVTVQIRLIEIPVEIVYTGPTDFNLIHGDLLEIEFELLDIWHNTGVSDAVILYTQGSSAIVDDNVSYSNGNYLVSILVVGSTGDSIIRLTLVSEFHESIEMQVTVTANPNDTDILISQFTNIGLPISFLVILLLGLYVRVWSVPKRIRQINGQVKALRKGKIPKPISDVKGRSEIIAELFNDTYAKTTITRTAAQMPEDSIPIDVPEMGELLVQLAILTNLDAGELEEFKADIAKMKISEQAAFVNEVIVQEAIRAGRRDGKTVEEVIADVEKQARQRLAGESEDKLIVPDVVEPTTVETVILDTEEPSVDEESLPEPTEETTEEPPTSKSEKMSAYEIEELRKELENKGVLPHEINTIIEQAKELPRELIEELVKSLEGDTK